MSRAPAPGRPREKEADELGDAIVRMMRALVVRAGEADTIAIEQLQRIDQLSSEALRLGVEQAHDRGGYSWTTIGEALNISRQAAQQLAGRIKLADRLGVGHVLIPGHDKRTCALCREGTGR